MILIENIIPERWQADLNCFVERLPFTYNVGTSYDPSISNQPEFHNIKLERGRDFVLDDNTIDTPQFVFLPTAADSEFREFRPFLYLIENHIEKEIKSLGRIKVNCLLQNKNLVDNKYNIAHVDSSNVDPSVLSAIYYVNDSDGDTFFFNEHCSDDSLVETLTIKNRITPKMGSIVVFPSTQFHASSNPVNSRSRFVINFLFKV